VTELLKKQEANKEAAPATRLNPLLLRWRNKQLALWNCSSRRILRLHCACRKC